MKCSTSFIVLALCATAAFAQSTSTAPKSSPVPSTSTSTAPALQPRGPDAVAKEQPAKVVATINGKQITAQQAAELMSSLSAQDRKKFENNLPGLLQQLYMEDQIAAAAAKENLDQKDRKS